MGSRSDLTLYFILSGVSAQSGGEPSPSLKCLGGDPCIGSKTAHELNGPINYWYNATDHQCSALPLQCLVNASVTFSDRDDCRVGCGG